MAAEYEQASAMSLRREMDKTRDNKAVWNRYARFYDFEINRFNGKAYAEMYLLMAGSLRHDMDVLEVATGTGVITLNIAKYVRHVKAIDFSPKMIKAAKRKTAPGNIHFSVEDATALPYGENTFDAVIISNALHVMPDPAKVLSCISKVLKPQGLLIAPSYSHGHISETAWRRNAKMLRLIGFETYSKWSPDEYVTFIQQNGYTVEKWQVLRAAFPLVYLEARLN